MGSFEEKLTRRVKEIEWKRLSFITPFKIEFLLPLTSCRKVLGKMPTTGVYLQCFLMIVVKRIIHKLLILALVVYMFSMVPLSLVLRLQISF